MSPAPRLVGAIALVAVVVVVLGPVAGLLVAALVVVGLALDLSALRRSIEVSVTYPERLVRGLRAEMAVTVDLHAASRSSATPHRSLTPRRTAAVVRQPAPVGVVIDPATGKQPLSSTVVASRRGMVRFPPVGVRVEGPWRLLRRTTLHGGEPVVPVIPDLPSARRIAAQVQRSSAVWSDGRGVGALGIGTDFDSVREYVANDDVRRINWSASARTGGPMTNQYREEDDRQVLCVLDCGRLMGAPVGDATRLDVAVDAALALAVVAESVGDRCGLVGFDESVRVDLPARRAGLRHFVDAAASLEVDYVESRYDRVFGALAHRRRSLLVLFTDLFDEAAGRPLVAALPMLVRRHAVLVAGCLDPNVAAAAQAEIHTARDAYAAAVALSMQETQSALAANLERAGAQVITTSPERLSSASVQGYLLLKSRARL